MGRSDRLQQWLLRIGLIVAGVLLVRFAIDFSRAMKWWLAAPLLLLVVAALILGGLNSLRWPRLESSTAFPLRRIERELLLAAIPLSFLAASLGCSGLTTQGCSPFCTFVKLVWIPLIATLCAAHFFVAKDALLTVIAAAAFVPLFPHCVCDNVGNRWWIDRIGASPVCYVWGLAVSVIAIGALRKAANPLPSLVLSFAVIAGATSFFISHHYYHFPW